MKSLTRALAIGLALSLLQSGVWANAATSTQLPTSHGRVSGRVVLSPVCPVQHIPPDPACAPKPYKTTLLIRGQVSGHLYKTVRTSSTGTFALLMAPGKYILQVKQGAIVSMYPRCAVVKFAVAPKKAVKLLMNCDTGIR